MTQRSPDRQANLPKQAIQGSLWVFLSYAAGKSLTFIATIILARLLLPAEYGVMAACLAALQYFEILNDFGANSALISRREKLEEAANAALIISMVSGLVMFGAAWVGAPYVAAYSTLR